MKPAELLCRYFATKFSSFETIDYYILRFLEHLFRGPAPVADSEQCNDLRERKKHLNSNIISYDCYFCKEISQSICFIIQITVYYIKVTPEGNVLQRKTVK